MSTELNQRVISLLMKAYDRFLRGDEEGYRKNLEEADRLTAQIEELGIEPASPRIMELILLHGERLLLSSLPVLNQPEKLIPIYQAAIRQIVLLPSRVVAAQMGYLPSYENLFDFYGVPPEEADRLAEQLEEASRLFQQLTNGGSAGVAPLYRAEAALRRGDRITAWAEAQEAYTQAMFGGQLDIKEAAERLTKRIEEMENEGYVIDQKEGISI